MEQIVPQTGVSTVEPMQNVTLPKGRWSVGGTLFLVDQLALSMAVGLALAVRRALGGMIGWQEYLKLWPVMGLFPLYFLALRLYPGTGLRPPTEIKRVSLALFLGFASLAGLSFLTKTGASYSRAVFLLSWLFALAIVPLARLGARNAFGRWPWWGEGVLILGAGKTGELVVRAMQREAGMGLRPIALLDDHPKKWGQEVAGVKVEGPLSLAPRYAEKGVRYAVLAMPGVSSQRLVEIIENNCAHFPHLVLIPDFFGSPSLWVQAQDLGGILGLEVEQKLLRRRAWWFKRALDLLIVGLTFPLWGTLMLVGAALVRLSSPGPIFFWQERLGYRGTRFRVCKFRTMYVDAETRLKELLARDDHLREEFERFHKLRNDPRVPALSRFLRKWSLDELPQIWNVIRGEMSLVGPRAYMPQEREDMQGLEEIILKVRPGITGLWQVSGRNRLSFADRLRIDVYYVRNWSMWLDVYILLKTVKVVLRGEGAY